MFSVALRVVAEAAEAEEQQNSKNEHRIASRKLRDHANPLELPQTLFEKYYRVNKPAFKYLLDELTSAHSATNNVVRNIPTCETKCSFTFLYRRQQVSDSEKLSSQNPPSFNEQHVLYTPVLYISGNGGYVAAPSTGFTLPQQSGLQQQSVSATAASGSTVTSQPPIQLIQSITPAVSSRQQTDLYKMQPHSAQSIYGAPNATNNSTGRTNQTAAGNIYRQNASSSTQKNRYVHSTAIYPTMHQSVVLGQFSAPFATRTPQLQQCQYSPQFYPPMYYPYYVRMAVPQQQRAPVNAGVGVGINRTMALQTGGSVSGPTTSGNQCQIPLGIASVTANTTAAKTIRVTMPQQLPPPAPQQQQQQQQSQNSLQIKEKPRSHALQIIHPITNRNILDDLETDKNESAKAITAGSATLSLPTYVPKKVLSSLDIKSGSSITLSPTSSIKLSEKLSKISKSHMDIVQSMQSTNTNRIDGGTICSVDTNIKGKTEENIKQITDVSTTTADNSKRVQESLPKNIKQQVPQEEKLKDKQEGKGCLSSKSQLFIKISSDKSISKITECKEISTEEYFDGSEKNKSIIYNIKESVESMQQEEIENLTLTQEQEQINIIYSNVQQKLKTKEQQRQETECSKLDNETKLITTSTATTATTTTTTILNEAFDIKSNNNNNNSSCNNNKKANILHKTNVVSTNTTTTTTINAIKSNEQIAKKNNNNNIITEKFKTPTTAGTKGATVVSEARKPSIRSSNKATYSKIEARNKTDKTNNSTKDDLTNKQKISNTSTKSTTTSIAVTIPPTPPPKPTPIIASQTKGKSSDIATSNEANKAKDDKGGEEKTESVTRSTTTTDKVIAAISASGAHSKEQCESLVSCNETQGPPAISKKQYNREQLMQLRKAKASRMQPDVKNTSIFLQTCLMPAFAYRANKKIHVMAGGFAGGGGVRGNNSGNANYQNFMKQSLMSSGGGVDSGHHNRSSDKSIIHLNLSLNQEVKLKESDNAWLPKVLLKSSDTVDNPEREKEELLRRVRGILNKLTPEKFEPLVEEIIKLKIDTLDKMEAVMILVIEKAIDEPNFSESYASLCHRLINEVKARDERMESGTKNNLASFRSALLDKMEQEFTQNITKGNAKEEKLKPIREKISNSKDVNEKVELEVLLDEEERKIRRRSGGTVRFIGELFKISILTGKIINTCIDALLKDPNNEDMLECLCKLLTTVGQKFEQTSCGKDDKAKMYSLENVIQRMQNIAMKTENSKISSRVRFMLQDVIDLRKKMWQSTRNEAPKTMEQIEKEANNEQLSNPYHYMNTPPTGSVSVKRDDRGSCSSDGRNIGASHNQRGGDIGNLKRQPGGMGSSGHSQSGNSSNDDTWHVQTGKGNRSVVVDSSKLFGMTVDINNKKMGGAALFQWNSTTSQPTSTPSNSFAALSLDANISSDRDRNRDRSGPRNKGSYNKGSMERERDRDRYDHDNKRLLSRSGATQGMRENSSYRSMHGGRGANSTNMQKATTSGHSKYQQPISSSSSLSKKADMPSSSSCGVPGGTSTSSLYRDIQEQARCSFATITHHQQQRSQLLTTPPPAVFKEPSDMDLKLIKSVVIEMVENAAASKCLDDSAVCCIKKLNETQLCSLLYYILTDYLHLANVGPSCRQHLAKVVEYLIVNNYITVEHFRLAYKNFAELASELMVDIPELWLYIFEFTGPLIVKKLISVNDLWNAQLRESGSSSFSLKFLKTFLQYCTREVGPNFTRNMLKQNHIKWSSFMNENEVAKFIETNKFEYVENENCQPDIDSKECKEKRNKRVLEHIEQMLNEGSNADSIIDYINGNIIDIENNFIKSLTRILISSAITHPNNYSLDSTCFKIVCIPVLLLCLGSREDLKLECLNAIQLLDNSLEHPKGLLEVILAELSNADVISQDTLIAWHDSKEQSAEKEK